MTLWRISNYASLNGKGGMEYSARWHTAGRPIVYLAETPAGALLEVLAHLIREPEDVPDRFKLLRIEVTGQQAVKTLKPPSGTEWRADTAATRAVGDRWLAAGVSALAKVPSALVPQTWNYLLNPVHSQAALLQIRETYEDRYDERLLGIVS